MACTWIMNSTTLTTGVVVLLGVALAVLFATQTGVLTQLLGEQRQDQQQYYQQEQQP